ncbi:spermidine/putrescine ABC transporter permease PotB [Pantoea sp. Mhis]|uniref:spermidine/putrescine ABC transporter permease PotB n=1 Tax=Pantoea sp. Mhis TaxID=2576759 RepID=UPI00135BD789|nr:spermidine/putrescine ABC transporter permease PotB [Pantoea sp. Mhis]MXP56322.1 spermidine/putrescine ABC transporter permease PotB [Pantoea sp. Mhis]
MKLISNRLQKSIIIIIIGWLILFVLVPNIMIFTTSFLTRNNEHFISVIFTLNNYIQLKDPLYTHVFLHSLHMAFITTICCLSIGYPFAWCLIRLPKHIRPLMLFLLMVPFWTNSLIRIYGLKMFLSTRGWLNNFLLWIGLIDKPFRIMYTSIAVILGLIYILLPFMVLPLYSSLDKLDQCYLEAARDLGANRIKTFIRIVLPLTMPGIIAGCLLIFIPSMGLFYVADLMGGAKDLMIGNIIKNQFLNIRDWPFGSATSIVMILFMWLLIIIYWRVVHIWDAKMELQ